MSTTEKIIKSEQKYNSIVETTADAVFESKKTRLVLVAGPSCSGKTTTTRKLVEHLEHHGIHSHMISIDDFYKDIVKDEAERDFESLESIDLDNLHEVLSKLSAGERADIPNFDFTEARKIGIRDSIVLGEHDIAMIEGLHALNPAIYKNFVDEDKIFRIFLDCYDTEIESKFAKYPRLTRRLVRDSNFRNADAEKTFYLWKNVLKGEGKYIYPFSLLSDVRINTHFDYELSVLKPYAKRILEYVGKSSEYFEKAKEVLKYLSLQKEETPCEFVPTDSMLREFIG